MKSVFDTMCEKAGHEEVPKVHVAERTIALIEANEIQTSWFWDRPLMWVAALSSAVAVPLVVMAFVFHNFWSEPLYEISQAISWAM
jgi:hypothetical protein